MKLTRLRINHLYNPVGYDLDRPTASFLITEAAGKRLAEARITVARDPAFEDIVWDSGAQPELNPLAVPLDFETEPAARYYWKVWAKDDAGDAAESAPAFFETPEPPEALAASAWITPDAEKHVQAAVIRRFPIEKPVRSARLTVTGLGLYELYLNGEKQGDECLLPGFTAYDSWIQYQTFPLDLRQGENEISILLGDGWYKGNYGLSMKKYENYGDRLAAIALLRITYEDGTTDELRTDGSWSARKSPVVESGIYSGEIYRPGLRTARAFPVRELELDRALLRPRLSPPITVHERIKPLKVLRTPAGETVLDMGQEMTGWLAFHCAAPRGTKIRFQFGEILQNGNFYRDNLRSAKAEFLYISNGRPQEVRQHFTFYGFRYVKVTGWQGKLNPEDFTGLVIHSEIEPIGEITTSDPLVNRLFKNARWGMKGNFLDVPTDCPQRDERYGWTGDAQIFSGTACFLADPYAFYRKYGRDLWAEQRKLHGSVPDVVPVANCPGDGTTAWGDAATVIPWNAYLHTGDPAILAAQYDSMRGWVDYMLLQDDVDGGHRLWRNGRHYGDWLALDGKVPGGVYGGTDQHFIASAYYFYSASIVSKAAAVLGRAEDAAFYERLAREIREAFLREYFTPNGRLAVDTMTAYVMALFLGLIPDGARERLQKGLLDKLKQNRYHLETGFVGTPWLCRVLSENGMHELACHLFLEPGYPGWLYEVLMGATTVWERWNSVLPDGKISGTEMNSLNHYAYGSIVEWMFRELVGIQPKEDAPGFASFVLAPKPDYRFEHVEATLLSASGPIASAWKLDAGAFVFRFTVPFNTTADILLPSADEADIQSRYGGTEGVLSVKHWGDCVRVRVEAGSYTFTYTPAVPCRKTYSLDSPFEELMGNPATRAVLEREYLPLLDHIPFEGELYTLDEMTWGPFTGVDSARRARLDRLLREVEG